MGTSSSSHTTQ